MSLRPVALVALAVAMVGLSACQETRESPTQPSGKLQYIPLDVRCTLMPSLRCSVQRFGQGDLTAEADWFATDVIWVGNVDRRVSFPSAGVPVPSERVQVYIAARVGTESRASSFSYELAPSAVPVPMAMFTGYVFDGDTGFVGVSGVTIELQGDGIAAQTATTDVNGRYAFTHVSVGVPLTIRASRSGFGPETARHDGIKPAEAEGFPDWSTTVQHFRLVRQP